MLPLNVRPATLEDIPAMVEIYNAGIAERLATFETESKTAEDLAPWLKTGLPIVVVERGTRAVGFAAARPYSDRCAYWGVVDFSVYVAPEARRQGVGRLAMDALLAAVRAQGRHKITSRITAQNAPSLSLMQSLGFRIVGTYEKHGQLDGEWRDVVAVELIFPENL